MPVLLPVRDICQDDLNDDHPLRPRRYVVTAEMVEEKTKDLLANVDMSKFVL